MILMHAMEPWCAIPVHIFVGKIEVKLSECAERGKQDADQDRSIFSYGGKGISVFPGLQIIS